MDTAEKARMKRKQPSFTRQDNHKKRLASGWRRPRGLQSKMRLRHKGYKRVVKVGYGSPVALRHTYQGKQVIHVATLSDVAHLPKECAVILAGTLGLKKRKAILEAIPKHITVLNASLDAVVKKIAERKPVPVQKEEKAETKAKTPAKKKKAEPELSEGEKKQQEKKELDKLLIHTD